MTPQNPSPAPRQARSRATLERILGALEELLDERPFEQVSMTAIAKRAKVAVGTIYTRFPDKDALLPALFERHDRAAGPRVEALLRELFELPDLDLRVRRLVAFAVDYHLRWRGLLRALTFYVRSNPESVLAQTVEERRAQYGAVADALLGTPTPIAHAQPRAAVLFTLASINSICREQLLFEDVSPLHSKRSRTKSRRAWNAFANRLADLAYRDLTGRPLPSKTPRK